MYCSRHYDYDEGCLGDCHLSHSLARSGIDFLGCRYRNLTFLTADVAAPGFVGLELLTNDGEVGLVRGQTQHNEVSVCATQTVLRVRIMIGLS